MRLSRTLTLIAALALPAVPAAAQGKSLGSPTAFGRPATAGVKAPKAPKPAADTTMASSETKGRGQLPLGEKLALNAVLKKRLEVLLAGGPLTYDQATTGWKNQGQLVAAMNQATNKSLPFASIYTEVVTNGKNLPDAVAEVTAAMPPTTTATAPTTTTAAVR